MRGGESGWQRSEEREKGGEHISRTDSLQLIHHQFQTAEEHTPHPQVPAQFKYHTHKLNYNVVDRGLH